MATLCLIVPALAQVGELRVPAAVTAGSNPSIATSGSGDATFYLVGPGVAAKERVHLGQDIQLDELQRAGKYTAVLCAESCKSASFYVTPTSAAKLSFLVHPSRAAVGVNDVISGVVFPFDQFQNLVLTPATINFRLTVNGADLMSRSVPSQNGIAWFRSNSGNRAGMAELTASLGDLTVRRAVQQVASEPCNLRIKGERTSKGIVVETDPVRDCAGNPVPDGTIVTFTASGTSGKSTIDAPIKQGVARAQILASGTAVVSVASGVVMGNELRIEGRP